MTMSIRSAAIALFASAAVLSAPTMNMTPPANAAKALMVGGLNSPTNADFVMQWVLSGEFIEDDRVSVYWPAQAGPWFGALTLGQSVLVGIPFLESEVRKALATGEPVKIVGISAGAFVVDEVLRRWADDPAAPDPSKVTFVVIGDDNRQQLVTRYDPFLDFTFRPLPDTPYNVTVVIGEYDGFVDYPDDPSNLVAIANAGIGAITMHLTSIFTDLSTVPSENITETVNSRGGVTTTYFVPAEHLPLVQLLPFLAPFEDELREVVDAAYDRNNDQVLTSSAASDLTTTQTSQRSTPAVDSLVGSQTELVEESADDAAGGLPDVVEEAPDDAAGGLADVGVNPAGSTDDGLDIATKSVLENTKAIPQKVAEATDDKKVSSVTTAGTSRASTGWRPGGETRTATKSIKRVLSGNAASTSNHRTGTPTSDASTEKGSEPSSSTPSTSGAGQAQ
jgi:hypothetical protein